MLYYNTTLHIMLNILTCIILYAQRTTLLRSSGTAGGGGGSEGGSLGVRSLLYYDSSYCLFFEMLCVCACFSLGFAFWESDRGVFKGGPNLGATCQTVSLASPKRGGVKAGLETSR